jgi:hypothetical protein
LQDPSLSEALFYLHVLAVAASDSAHEVVAATPGLQDALKHMVATLGEIRLRLQQQQLEVCYAYDVLHTLGLLGSSWLASWLSV